MTLFIKHVVHQMILIPLYHGSPQTNKTHAPRLGDSFDPLYLKQCHLWGKLLNNYSLGCEFKSLTDLNCLLLILVMTVVQESNYTSVVKMQGPTQSDCVA